MSAVRDATTPQSCGSAPAPPPDQYQGGRTNENWDVENDAFWNGIVRRDADGNRPHSKSSRAAVRRLSFGSPDPWLLPRLAELTTGGGEPFAEAAVSTP